MSIIYNLPIISQMGTNGQAEWWCWLIAPTIIMSKGNTIEEYNKNLRIIKKEIGEEKLASLKLNAQNKGLEQHERITLYAKLNLKEETLIAEYLVNNDSPEVFFNLFQKALLEKGPLVYLRPAISGNATHLEAIVGIIKTQGDEDNPSGISLVINDSMNALETLLPYQLLKDWVRFWTHEKKFKNPITFYYSLENIDMINTIPKKELAKYHVIDDIKPTRGWCNLL